MNGFGRFLVPKNGKEPRFVSIYESWFRAVPSSEERKRTKIRSGWLPSSEEQRKIKIRLGCLGFRVDFRRSEEEKPRFVRENERESVIQKGKGETSERVRVNFRRMVNQDSIGWASMFRRMEKPRFVYLGFFLLLCQYGIRFLQRWTFNYISQRWTRCCCRLAFWNELASVRLLEYGSDRRRWRFKSLDE
ncbi:unnamed protein product [Rhizophagus irregularis]|nr:unnamed protein product [Rhizophagus irregularis]